MSPAADDWSIAEIVRNLQTLTEAVNTLGVRFEARFDQLDERYVRIDVWQSQNERVAERLGELSRDVERLCEDAADAHQQRALDVSGTWRFWVAVLVGPVLTGLLVGAVLLLLRWQVGA